MATTFHITNFKNKQINIITGVNSITPPQFSFMNVFNGAQPVDPSATPVGSSVYTSAAASLTGFVGAMSAAAVGVSSLSTPRTLNAASTVANLTFARLYDQSSNPLIDTSVGLSSGGAIVSSLSSSAGVAFNCQAISLKLAANFGTLKLSTTVINRLVDLLTAISTTRLDLGVNALIDIYSGTPPTTADAVATGTLLATFTGSGTNWFIAAQGGSTAVVNTQSTTAIGTGTATYFRWYKTVSSVLFTIQGVVGTVDGDALLNTVSMTSGVTPVTLNELTLSL